MLLLDSCFAQVLPDKIIRIYYFSDIAQDLGRRSQWSAEKYWRSVCGLGAYEPARSPDLEGCVTPMLVKFQFFLALLSINVVIVRGVRSEALDLSLDLADGAGLAWIKSTEPVVTSGPCKGAPLGTLWVRSRCYCPGGFQGPCKRQGNTEFAEEHRATYEGCTCRSIQNAALDFCTAVTLSFAWRWHDLPKSLGKSTAELICRTVLAGAVSPDEGAKEVVDEATDPSTPKPTSSVRVWSVDLGHHKDWHELLEKVCQEECHDLVNRIKRDAIVLTAMGPEWMKEECAKEVVQKVEAEAMSCCKRSCGWDDNTATCAFWPFMDDEEQRTWKLQCCAEDTILQHSSREKLCNSVELPAKRPKLVERDPAQLEQGVDDKTVGQSLFQAGPKECDGDKLQGCAAGQRKQYLRNCQESEMGWQFIDTEEHEDLSEDCDGKEEEITVEACHNKLTSGIRSVSWLKGKCTIIQTSCKKAKDYDEKVVTTVGDAATTMIIKLNT